MRRLIDTVLESQNPVIFVHSELQAESVREWCLSECPNSRADEQGSVVLPDGRQITITIRSGY